MERQIITPTDEQSWLSERAKDVTSTEVAALFGCSPYLTRFELWHRKKNATVVTLDKNERMTWGLRLEKSISWGIAEDQKWLIRRMDEYMRLPEIRLGASFDYKIDGGIEAETKEGEAYNVQAILEVKNVDSLAYRDGWLESNGDIEAPPHIEIQIQVQMAVSGIDVAYIGALVGGNKVVLIKREANEKVISVIKEKVFQFWQTIDSNVEPAPDFKKDAGFINKLYGYASPGKVLNLESDKDALDSAVRYRELGKEIKEKEEQRDAIKAEFLRKIVDAEKVIGGKYSISAGLVGPAHVEYDREGYRMFKINWKKEKK